MIVHKKTGILRIETIYGDYICEHGIGSGRGLQIQNKSHMWDCSTAPDRIQADLEDEPQGQANEYLQAPRRLIHLCLHCNATTDFFVDNTYFCVIMKSLILLHSIEDPRTNT